MADEPNPTTQPAPADGVGPEAGVKPVPALPGGKPEPAAGAARADGTLPSDVRRLFRIRDAIWGVLPGPLRRLIPATFVGFAIINLFTFSVDLGLLSLLHGLLRWPLPIAVTIAYATAFTLSFVGNRRYNFHSQRPVGLQIVKYVGAVAVNYLAFILGLTVGLHHLGVPAQIGRLIAGCCEAIFMYCAMRWFVFAAKRPETA